MGSDSSKLANLHFTIPSDFDNAFAFFPTFFHYSIASRTSGGRVGKGRVVIWREKATGDICPGEQGNRC